MKIVVISDTHIPKTAEWLPKKLCDELKEADMILHAGDLTEVEVLDRLKAFGPVKAVRGNMDDAIVQRLLPQKEIIKVGRFKIGLMHGFGPPFGLVNRIGKEFKEKVDVIVFGHSHSPKNEIINGRLFFNPGSPTDKFFASSNSFGILEIKKEIKGEIIKL